MNLQVELTKPFLKTQVLILRHFLEKGGTDLSQSSAYNLLAEMYGFKDWNTLAAKFKEHDKISISF